MEFFRGKNLDESMMTTIKHDNVRIMFIMSICVAVMELVFLIIAFLFENSPISSPTSERSVTFGLFIQYASCKEFLYAPRRGPFVLCNHVFLGNPGFLSSLYEGGDDYHFLHSSVWLWLFHNYHADHLDSHISDFFYRLLCINVQL